MCNPPTVNVKQFVNVKVVVCFVVWVPQGKIYFSLVDVISQNKTWLGDYYQIDIWKGFREIQQCFFTSLLNTNGSIPTR